MLMVLPSLKEEPLPKRRFHLRNPRAPSESPRKAKRSKPLSLARNRKRKRFHKLKVRVSKSRTPRRPRRIQRLPLQRPRTQGRRSL